MPGMQQTLRTLPRTQTPPVAPSYLCRAKNSAAGVPQVVTCRVTLASSSFPATFKATAYQGSSGNQKDTDLRSAESDPYT